MTTGTQGGPVPPKPRQGEIWWSAAPLVEPTNKEEIKPTTVGVPEEQLREWLSCTAGWKALELTWGALQSCDVKHHQLKPLLQAALAEAARMGAQRLVVRQLDVDEVVGRWCLALALSAFPNFTILQLRELNLYDEAMGHVSGALHSSEHLQRLVLDTVWASAGGWSALAAAVKVNTSLRTLRIRHCLTASGPALTALCSALADQRGVLEELRLPHNELRDAGVGEVCKALSHAVRPSHVAHLDLSYNGASGQCVPAVAAMLRAVRSLRHLDLSYNELGAEGARELCRALWYAPHLTSLRLAATGADDSAVEALCRALYGTASTAAAVTGAAAAAGPSRLAAICLSYNRLSHRGAALLAAAAKRPGCGLVDVDLAGNGQVGEAGAKAWADVLSSPAGGSRLQRLVLSGCEVPDGGVYALGAALKTNTCLRELGLAENHISTSGLALLAEVVKVNSSLQLLDVSLNMVGPQGMTPFNQMSHLRGHVLFSKAHDHTVQRVSSCLVKRELLREYRAVEAVKHSSEPWERDRIANNPFLNPTAAAAAAAGGGSGGAWGGGGDGDGDVNPFLSPSASYVNPFLQSPRPSASGPRGGGGGGGGGGPSNPFLDGLGSPGANPFHSPAERPPPLDNPFLSLPKPASEDGGGDGEEAAGGRSGGGVALVAAAAAGEGADPVAGWELATRVVARQGSPRHSAPKAAAAAAHGGGADDNGADGQKEGGAAAGENQGGGDGASTSASGTGVYVSSRSTADEADLVTDLDLRLVDYMLETLGVPSTAAAEAPGSGAPARGSSPHGPHQHRSALQSVGRSKGNEGEDEDGNEDGDEDEDGDEHEDAGPAGPELAASASGREGEGEGRAGEGAGGFGEPVRRLSAPNPFESHQGWHLKPEPYDPDDTGANNPFL